MVCVALRTYLGDLQGGSKSSTQGEVVSPLSGRAGAVITLSKVLVGGAGAARAIPVLE